MRILRALAGATLASVLSAACVGDLPAAVQGDAGMVDAAPDADVSDAANDTYSPPQDAAADVGADSPQDTGAPPDAADGSAFDANFYGGLELWLSADVGITAGDAGNEVVTWSDRSSQHRQATVPAADGNCQGPPTLVPSAVHGLPMVNFNGGTQCMTVSGAFTNFSGGFTAFVVFQPGTCNSTFLGNSGAIFDAFDPSGTYTAGIMIGRNPTPAQNASGDAIFSITNSGGAGDVGIIGGGSWVPGTPEVLEFRLPAAAGGALVTGTAYVNGTLASMSPNNPFIPDFSTARNKTYLGYRAQQATGYHLYCGMIGEILVYSKALTDADRQAVESHLRTRWSL